MNSEMYYQQVKRWIGTYRDAAPLSWLRRFVDNSQQPKEIKDKLHNEINKKIAQIENKPWFAKWKDDKKYLTDNNGYPEIYTTRFAAMNKLIQLKKQGYDVDLHKGMAFFRIELKSELQEGLQLTTNQ